jgi:type III pantothenate kinase
MKLLVDFGNTRLKWALWADGRRRIGGVFAHRETTLEAALSSNWSALPRPQAILVASVVDSARERDLAELIEAHFETEAEFVRSPASGLGVTNAYVEPERLGVDRFLAMAALHASHPRAQVAIGCGTALTLDALGADGRHLGGLIAPSPALMRESLGRGTARVGEEPGHLVEIADNTMDAAHSGCLFAAVALIERFRVGFHARIGAPVAIVADGGGVGEWLHLLPDVERGRDLVLQGLALWAEHESARRSP